MLTILRIERQSKGLKRLGTVLKRKVGAADNDIRSLDSVVCISDLNILRGA